MQFDTNTHRTVNTKLFFSRVVPVLLTEEREFAVAPRRQGLDICVAGGWETMGRVKELIKKYSTDNDEPCPFCNCPYSS